MAANSGVTVEALKARIEGLSEVNPMLGFRGCRLGIVYPEITEMQTRAIIEAALKLKKKGIEAKPEIMIPLTGILKEFQNQRAVVLRTAEEVFREYKDRVNFKVGTMIAIPRATLIADQIAQEADFFSFGTNDLTQMTFGFSRDDIGKFLPYYLEQGILKVDPFRSIDPEGVLELMKTGVTKGRGAKKSLTIGICGEHGGDPTSVGYCHELGMDYVSCSPFRVPIARLAAAQAAIR